MPKRSNVTLEDVADWNNLVWAAYRAARGKRQHSAVQAFLLDLDANLSSLRQELLDGTLLVGQASSFRIFDPKPRTIHAPIFLERVLHHALMRHVGPVLENSLVDDTFACRVGKGAIAAVKRSQYHSQRYPWYGKLDVRSYFPSICHAVLLSKLRRKFKDRRLLRRLEEIVYAHQNKAGRGLPIGALTSQNFANFYLNSLDRHLLEQLRVRGMVRYMDDVVWWCDSKDEVRSVAKAATRFLADQLSLQVRPPIQINRTERGVTVCGYRVFPATIRLSRRRRKLYQSARGRWESRFAAGLIDERTLQAGYASALGITLHSDSTAWRRRELKLHPPLAACRDI